LAENLQNAKAIAVPTEIPTGPSCENAWQATLNGTSREGDPGDVQRDDVLNHLLHPLFIALLTYRMGGPINAGTTLSHVHQWKLPDRSAPEDDPQNFHMEGDNKIIFADHRTTLVWKEIHGQSKGASRKHHIFMSGSGSGSTPFEIASSLTPSPKNTASVIFYDQRNAALVYECQEKDAVRHSLSLDFMLQTTDDDVFELFATPEATPTQLAALLLDRPIPNYGDYFDRILYGPASLGSIVSKLSQISMEPAPSAANGTLLGKANVWHKENNARVPPGICLAYDRKICSILMSNADFLYGLSWKAFRDLHIRIGYDMFPQNAIEEFRECARITIRDMSSSKVWERLAYYKSALGTTQFATSHMLPTPQLHDITSKIARKGRELLVSRFIDPTSVLASLPFFANALSKALNGPKQVEVALEFHFNLLDLQIYRTRCLYLFLCADWLAQYSNEPFRGLYMLPDADEVIGETETNGHCFNAIQLLQNWIAWCLFMETLLVIKRWNN
jgi:hypothetical protein